MAWSRKDRVREAIRQTLRGLSWVNLRRFEACFEFYDGDEVIAALIQEAKQRPEFAAAVLRERRYMPPVLLAALESTP